MARLDSLRWLVNQGPLDTLGHLENLGHLEVQGLLATRHTQVPVEVLGIVVLERLGTAGILASQEKLGLMEIVGILESVGKMVSREPAVRLVRQARAGSVGSLD